MSADLKTNQYRNGRASRQGYVDEPQFYRAVLQSTQQVDGALLRATPCSAKHKTLAALGFDEPERVKGVAVD